MSPAEVRAFLQRHGLAARRNLGQNFLVDAALAERLVSLAGVEAGDTVFEIGTGMGVLTRALADRATRVVSLEVDAGLVRALGEESLLPDNVELVHADVMRFSLEEAVRGTSGPVRAVTNLPYSITGPGRRRLLGLRESLVDWSVMLQREVAERLLASPGSRTYGSLTVLHRLTVEVTRGMELSPRCFHPVPKVRSVFVRAVPLRDPPLRPGELEGLERVVRAAFGQRRKTLANALRRLDPFPGPERIDSALAAAGIDRRARAESLAPGTLLALARALPGAD